MFCRVAVIGELRQQNTEKEAEVERLRNELISERQAKIEAVIQSSNYQRKTV
jgi:hypothetical protein